MAACSGDDRAARAVGAGEPGGSALGDGAGAHLAVGRTARRARAGADDRAGGAVGDRLPARRRRAGDRAGLGPDPRVPAGGGAAGRDPATVRGGRWRRGRAARHRGLPRYARDGLVYVYYTTVRGQPDLPAAAGPAAAADRDRHPALGHPQRRPAPLRTGRVPLRRHRGRRGGRPVPGRRLAGRQGAADDGGGPAGAGQPVPGLAGLVQGPPQRAGAGLRLGRPAVGQRVRAEPLRRGQPDRAAAGTTAGRPSRAPRTTPGSRRRW